MTKKKRKGGRKPVPGCRQISFWGNEREASSYKKAAKKAGVSRSKWLRRVANEAAK
jgi:hypothetical protein